jgi:fructuronate reductase
VRLSSRTLEWLSSDVERYKYDRNTHQSGIVHLGIGAFMRAHQATYTDDAMVGGDLDWMTTGVSLRSPAVHDQLSPQDGLYFVGEKSSAGTRYRLIGAVRNVLVAPHEPREVIAALADLSTRVVTITITEKGYRRNPVGSLDLRSEDVTHDIAGPRMPRTIYGFLAEALARRRAAGAAGLSLICCDNLSGNGEVLRSLLREFLSRYDPDLVGWFEANCTCPSTMVDRIVPATTKEDRALAEQATGLRDEGLVVTEPFSQWVIEDRFAAGRPRWEAGGAQFVKDVAPFETAKLRMLNGAHSAIAYLGLERGHEFVHQAATDPIIRPLVERLMLHEAAPTIDAVPGQDLAAYASELLTRLANPALEHRLVQIALDGSHKIPQRWLATLAASRREGRDCPVILQSIGAWLRHVRGDNGPVDDPMAEELKAIWETAGETHIIEAVFGPAGPLSSDWRPTKQDRAKIPSQLSTEINTPRLD